MLAEKLEIKRTGSGTLALRDIGLWIKQPSQLTCWTVSDPSLPLPPVFAVTHNTGLMQ
jgi:hypothetical protein